MQQFKKKAEYKFWHSPLILIALFLAVLLFAYNLVGLFEKEREANKKKILMLNQIDVLEKREASLEKDISRLKTDEGIEDAIRDKYQVVKEGEKMVVVVDTIEKSPSLDEATREHGFWNFIKKIFE